MALTLLSRRVFLVISTLIGLLIVFHYQTLPPALGNSPRPYPIPTTISNTVSALPFGQRLRHHFPYDVESTFPDFIWQTWKVPRYDNNFDNGLRHLVDSWDTENPGFMHEVIPDDAALHLIRKAYMSLPEVVQAYQDMSLPVLRADFFRYLILLARGGVYTDVDTEALQSIHKWIPDAFNTTAIGIVIGIEADPDRDDWEEWYARRIQFCQWTIMSKPGHPILREVVARVINLTRQLKEDGLLNQYENEKLILEHTGPGVWTDAIFTYFNRPENPNLSSRNVTNSDFYNLREPKIIDDVLILPITSFSPGIGHMGAESTHHPLAFVRHAFKGKSITLQMPND